MVYRQTPVSWMIASESNKRSFQCEGTELRNGEERESGLIKQEIDFGN